MDRILVGANLRVNDEPLLAQRASQAFCKPKVLQIDSREREKLGAYGHGRTHGHDH